MGSRGAPRSGSGALVVDRSGGVAAAGVLTRVRAAEASGAVRPELAARDRRVVDLYEAGRSSAEIARAVGISRDRVARIVARAGVVDREGSLAARFESHLRAARARAGEILACYREGVDPQLIARRLGLDGRALGRVVRESRSDADRVARARVLAAGLGPRFSDRQLLDGLRTVADGLGRPPTGPEYETVARRLRLASAPTVYMRFGSWSGALRAAGFEPQRAPARTARWDVEACWRALESVAGELGDPPRCTRYRKLVEQGREPATVRLRLGLWSDIAAVLSERRVELIGERELTA